MSTQSTTSDYLLLFRGDPRWDEGLSPEEMQQTMEKVTRWFEKLSQQGKVKAGQPLGEDGRTVSGNEGRTVVVDGPFAESKEAVGGYIILRVDDLDEVVAIAKACPSLQYGATIEIRPIVEECSAQRRMKEQLAHAMA